MSQNKVKPQVFNEQGNTLFGYPHPIVYNEIVRIHGITPAFNLDADPLTKDFRSKEVLKFAAESLGDDI